MEDLQLLREYAEHQSERAFTELVTRHTDFVYSTALRLVHESQLAGDGLRAGMPAWWMIGDVVSVWVCCGSILVAQRKMR
jgi:hypothetical protein